MINNRIRQDEKQRAHEFIDARVEEQTKLLKKLVNIPSISGTHFEGTVQEIVEEEVRKIAGVSIDKWEPVDEDLQRYPLHPIRTGAWNYDGRPVIVATIKGSGGGKSLILNGHVDVVSPEPSGQWKYDPYGGEVVDGKLFGRGSMDMKGGLVSMIYAARAVFESNIQLKGDLILESVVEEEFGGGGTVAAVVRGYKADAAIICEATSSDSIGIASGGSRFFRIKIIGKPEWPHLAHYGVNAIGLAAKVYDALMNLDERRATRLSGRHPILESVRAGGMRGPGRSTNMTIGIMKAGDWPATVAGRAEIEGRVGFPPSESGSEVQGEIEGVVKDVAGNDPWMRDHPPVVEWWGARREPFEISTSAAIVRTLEDNVVSLKGSCDLFGTSSASDAAFIAPKLDGFGGIPTVSYGPGGDGAHTIDEYVNLTEVSEVAKVLSSTMIDWCS